MKEPIGFVPKEREREIDIEDYKGSWIIISVKNNSSIGGKLEGVFKNRLLLMPYQTVNHSNGKQKYEIVREGLPYLIERIDISGIRQTDEKNIQEYCNYSNNQLQKEEFKKEIEFRRAIPKPRIVIVSH